MFITALLHFTVTQLVSANQSVHHLRFRELRLRRRGCRTALRGSALYRETGNRLSRPLSQLVYLARLDIPAIPGSLLGLRGRPVSWQPCTSCSRVTQREGRGCSVAQGPYRARSTQGAEKMRRWSDDSSGHVTLVFVLGMSGGISVGSK